MGVVGDTELVRHGEQERTRLTDRLVARQPPNQFVGLRGVGAAEDCEPAVDDTSLVAVRSLAESG